MEITYQGLRIRLPFEGVIGAESFTMDASFNEHVSVELVLLVDEDGIEADVHGIADGDSIEVYEDSTIFAGKITDTWMQRNRGLCYLGVKALSYTMEWALAPVIQSFQDLDMTYGDVLKKVLEDQPGAEIMDSVTQEAVIPDFLLQYEESDWEFLIRLASHFGTFLIPDCRAAHGRAYFGLPDLGEETPLGGEDYQQIKDMDQQYRIGNMAGILPQENIRWEITTGRSFCLAQKVSFQGISAVVTRIRYRTVKGELVRSYELSRRKGILCAPKKNPSIFGMSIPATVKERSGNCVRVHFHIDPVYESAPNIKYFPYAIESSFIYCMPEVGSQVHIYFPGDNESGAVAVHAIRMTTPGGGAPSGYAQIPDNKSFSNVDGAELLFTPGSGEVCSDGEGASCIILDTSGNAGITGTDIEIWSGHDISVGEPAGEGGQPSGVAVFEAGSLTFGIGEEDPGIDLTMEVRICAAFVKLEASDRSPADPPAGEVLTQVTAGDKEARDSINDNAAAQLVDKYEEGRSQILHGVIKVAATVGTVLVLGTLTVMTGGAAALAAPAMLGTIGIGAGVTAVAISDIGEGVDNVQKSQGGDLGRGHNLIRDDLLGGNQLAYDILKTGLDIAFGAVSGRALTSFQGLKTVVKTTVQTGGNVAGGVLGELIDTGTVDPLGLGVNIGLGMLQSMLGSSVTSGILGRLGITECGLTKKIAETMVGTTVDTGLDAAVSTLSGREFDFWDSLGRNVFANALAAFISDPVDAVTGIYTINTTDFILASLPGALKLERTYCSTSQAASCLGRGWSFNYGSRIYRDTKDTEHTRIHLETITGHSLCFEKQDGVWVNQCKGTARFLLEVREGAGFPEEETFLLSDVMNHTLCAYDRQGQLGYVEYPNRQRLTFTYDENGLTKITTPLGNVLEVKSRNGRIMQVTDETGRRTQYRYDGDYLADVVHTDEGITHYEYDGNGHITAVTDQNGSRYLENEYDIKGRITKQHFPESICQTFTYDDVHRRNTVYYSETGKTEIYEYNKELLTERTLYEDGTCVSFEYSDQNLKTKETSRTGTEEKWEYDTYGRVVHEISPDGFAVNHEYDENHDLVHTWDSEGRETQNRYDSEHNLLLSREKIEEGRWRETSYEYDSRGRRTAQTDALGNTTRWEYSKNSAHPVRFITPRGEETAYTYDRVGRRMSVTNTYGTVEMSYNSRNFVTSRTDGEGYTSHTVYDRMGNMEAYYSPRQWEEQGKGYEYRYDYLERVVDIISPLREHQRVYRNFDGDITREIHPVSYAEKGEDGDGTRYEYDNDGNCIRIHYADGGIERRFYDADGNMTKQVLPEAYDSVTDDGEGYCYAHDQSGNMTQVRDPDGNVLHTYEYNGHGQAVRETDGEGQETLYTYNGLGLVTKEQTSTRTEGDTTYYRVAAYTYDSAGNKVEEAYGQQEVEKDKNPDSWHRIYFSYDQNNHLTLVKDGLGAQMRYGYDCLGNVTLEERLIEEGIRSRIHYAYNKNGWRIRKTEQIQGNGDISKAVTSYGYDADGNLTNIKTPKGAEIRMEYDADSRIIEERVIDKKNGINMTTSYTYDAVGNVLNQTVTGADGERLETGWNYDLKDRLTHTINQSGAVTRYIYDQNDQLIKEIHPYGYEHEADNGKGTSYTYDKNGNLVRVTNGLGEMVQELSYNRKNLPVTQTDESGNRTDFAYEPDGQLKEVRRGNSRRQEKQRTIQQYEYNARGQIIGIIDGNHEKVTYDVDKWGRITGTGFSDGVREGYEYNLSGQVSRTVNGNGNTVQYRYNSFGKVRERIDQLGYKETFQYDEEGNLALHTDRDGRQVQRTYNVFGDPVYEKAAGAEGENPCISTWRYDSLGRLVCAVCNGHAYEYIYDKQGNLKEKRSNGKRLVSYAYDRTGKIKEIKDPAGVSTCYEYDILGRVSRIHSAEGMEVNYGYDSLDRIERISYGNGIQTTYAYDCDGNISCLETKTESAVLLSFTYQYDGNGNRTAKTGIQGLTAGSSALDISYRYDVRGQLLEERRNDMSVCYEYDESGNRIRKTEGQKETRYHYNEKNQLLREENADGIKSFTYDRQGGIVEEKGPAGIRRFSYNSRHQQTRVETETGNIQENQYDSEGLRYELLENGRCTSFVYHNGELLHEKGGETGLSREQTSYHLGAGIDSFQRNRQTFYYHQDEQLNTTLISDGGVKLKNQYQYDAFGVSLDALEELPNRIRYTGQWYDNMTGQYYLRARYYNPVLGRFMQEDIYQGDGLNLYAYCHSNPIMYYDPSGYDVTKNPVFNTQQDLENRLKYVPQKENDYGKWLGRRGDSYFKVNMDNTDPKFEKLINVLKDYGTDKVKYTNGMIDMEKFATFSTEVEIKSKRPPTHTATNNEIIDAIITYKGNYEKMYNDNVMGIASGHEYSQSLAKQIITSESIQNALKNSSNTAKKKAIREALKYYKKKYAQTIHETNLERGKIKNTTQWVPSEINNTLGHLGGTSEQGSLEKMQQQGCSKGK